jgi:hypothetical protein
MLCKASESTIAGTTSVPKCKHVLESKGKIKCNEAVKHQRNSSLKCNEAVKHQRNSSLRAENVS